MSRNPPARSLGFVERLHLAQRIKVEAEARAVARAEVSVPREVDTPEVLAAPLHACGIRMVRCADCTEFYCRAPGHARHVCRAFSQVGE